MSASWEKIVELTVTARAPPLVEEQLACPGER